MGISMQARTYATIDVNQHLISRRLVQHPFVQKWKRFALEPQMIHVLAEWLGLRECMQVTDNRHNLCETRTNILLPQSATPLLGMEEMQLV